MKFKCDRYPKLGVHGEKGIVAQFEDGLFETDDKAVIEIIKKVPEIELVDSEAKDEQAIEETEQEAQEIAIGEAIEVAPVEILPLEVIKEAVEEQLKKAAKPKKAAK